MSSDIPSTDEIFLNSDSYQLSPYSPLLGVMGLVIAPDVIDAIGGLSVVTRELFPPLFNGSFPSGGTYFHDGRYCIELPAGTSQKEITDLVDAIDAAMPTSSSLKNSSAK